jgi:DNA invertase Pin-like site-specific DNA recombinase
MTAAKRNGQRVGYKRVSTVDQKTLRQLDGVAVDKVFEDKMSGKSTSREGLKAALDYVREGDVLVCHSMDRLSRSLPDLLKLVEDLTRRGVTVEFMKENLTFNGDDNAMSKMLLGVMGSIAQFERELMLERQREGIAKAKEAGAYKGGKSKLDASQMQAVRDRKAAGESAVTLAREYGITRQTVYNLVAAQ